MTENWTQNVNSSGLMPGNFASYLGESLSGLSLRPLEVLPLGQLPWLLLRQLKKEDLGVAEQYQLPPRRGKDEVEVGAQFCVLFFVLITFVFTLILVYSLIISSIWGVCKKRIFFRFASNSVVGAEAKTPKGKEEGAEEAA